MFGCFACMHGTNATERLHCYLAQLHLRRMCTLVPLEPHNGCTAAEAIARRPTLAQACIALGWHQSIALNTAATCETFCEDRLKSISRPARLLAFCVPPMYVSSPDLEPDHVSIMGISTCSNVKFAHLMSLSKVFCWSRC